MKLGYIYGMKIRGDIKLGADPYSGDSSIIELGTWATPLLTAVATHVPISFVTTYTVAGNAVGGIFGVKGNNAAGNLNLKGLRAKATVLAAINIGTGAIDGLHTEVEVLAGGATTGMVVGERIEVYGEAGITLGSDVYGIYVSNYIVVSPAGWYSLCRLEHNGAAVLSAFETYAAGAAQVNYIFSVNLNGAKNACDAVTNKTGLAAAGFLKVQLSGMPGGGDRYIQLYGP